jgi:hypothetical protein
MIRTAPSAGSNTNLYLGNNQSSDNLMNLFSQKQLLLKDLKELRENKYSSQNTVNIMSEYVVQGSVKKKYIKLKSLLAFIVLGVLIAFTPIFWKFLKAYPNRNS